MGSTQDGAALGEESKSFRIDDGSSRFGIGALEITSKQEGDKGAIYAIMPLQEPGRVQFRHSIFCFKNQCLSGTCPA